MPDGHRQLILTTKRHKRLSTSCSIPGRSHRSSTNGSSFTSPAGQRSNRCSNLPSSTKCGQLPPTPARRMNEQQTLAGCAFCEAAPGTETGAAYAWGKEKRVSHPICVDCAIQVTPDPGERDRYARDSCGLVVDALAALTRFRVELGHLEAHSRSVPGVVLVGRRRTGHATSRSTSSSETCCRRLHRFPTEFNLSTPFIPL